MLCATLQWVETAQQKGNKVEQKINFLQTFYSKNRKQTLFYMLNDVSSTSLRSGYSLFSHGLVNSLKKSTLIKQCNLAGGTVLP